MGSRIVRLFFVTLILVTFQLPAGTSAFAGDKEIDESKYSLIFRPGFSYNFILRLDETYRKSTLEVQLSPPHDQRIFDVTDTKNREVEFTLALTCRKYDRKGNATLDGTLSLNRCFIKDDPENPVLFDREAFDKGLLKKEPFYRALLNCKEMKIQIKVSHKGKILSVSGLESMYKKHLSKPGKRGKQVVILKQFGKELFSTILFKEILQVLFFPFSRKIESGWSTPLVMQNPYYSFGWKKYPLIYSPADENNNNFPDTVHLSGTCVTDKAAQKKARSYFNDFSYLKAEAEFYCSKDKHALQFHDVHLDFNNATLIHTDEFSEEYTFEEAVFNFSILLDKVIEPEEETD